MPDTPLAAALNAADLRVLVMCLYHFTGDERWLKDPYRPSRDVNLIADPTAGFDAETAATIRGAMADLLADGVPQPVIDDPGPQRFHEMMSTFLGESVDPEYVPWIRQDMGLDEPDAQWRSAPAERHHDIDVVIIGAGFSGLALATKLDQLGIQHVVIEKNADVGGTWFENRYPGCGVDTPNHFYQYSFAPNPGWEHYFSPRDEIYEYLQRCAAAAGVRPRMRVDTRATAAVWDDEQHRWIVTCEPNDGGPTYTVSGAVLVAATGHFNSPITAPFDGIDEFAGPVFHTARWPQTPVDLTGKHVAVIGTGASAMQLVPTIAPDIGQLSVFQRTPQWVKPTADYNAKVDPASRWLFENLEWYGRWYRFGQMWRYGDGLLRWLRRDPDFEHPHRAMNPVNDRHREEMTAFIRRELADRPDLVEHCIPDYPPFGKRILLDNDWFKTLRRDNVTLVPHAVDRIEPTGVGTVDGELHDVDAIVLATGFNITDLTAHIDIIGRHGQRLADDWADKNPTAYLGISVPRFPNLFVMYGPNTNMGHGGSGIWLGETQTRFICDRIVDMVENGLAAIDVRADERHRYTQHVDELHAELVWAHPGTPTYYRTKHGKVRSPMPFRLVDYWTMCTEATLDPYDVTVTPK